MSTTADTDQTLIAEIRRIAADVAAAHADAVDRDGRFPIEAVTALREARALSALAPAAFGGGGASLQAISRACYELGRACSSTAMVFAMHQIQVGTIVRHLDGAPWFEEYLRELSTDQRLIASVTSEIGTGGDMGRSIAAVTPTGNGRLRFEKQAPTVSYGGHCDDLLTTVRSAPDAEESHQVMVLHRAVETELEPAGTWDTIGMRGTCSPGFVVRAEFSPEQILAAPFGRMMGESIVPLSHIFWSHAWLGIATEAFERGRRFVRDSALRAPGTPVPAANGLSRVMADLTLFRSEVASALRDFEAWSEAPDREPLNTMASVLRFNNLKLATSEAAPRICGEVLQVIGIMAFKNDSKYGVGRQLRDTLSARLMVANDRIHAVDAGLLAIAKEV